MEYLISFFSLFGCGCFSVVPTALAAAAIVDILRVRAEWYWLFIALGIPVLGPASYFLVSYGPWANRLGRLSPAAARRAEAKRRLRELDIQLQHWRGPAILAEAGELLLTLGKAKRAEALLHEARDAGAGVKEASYPLAQVLQVYGRRYSQAIPLLEELCRTEPDYKFGAARLALARCLDETGEAERAEDELRQVLAKRSPPEAKVRLARLLLRRGGEQEASRLLAEVRADATGMPAYLRRQHGAWLRAAKRLGGGSKLPAPRLDEGPAGPRFWHAVVLALAAVCGVALAAGWLWTTVAPWLNQPRDMIDLLQRMELASERIKALDEGSEAEAFDLATFELDAATLEQLIAIRRALLLPCQAIETSRAREQTGGDAMESWRQQQVALRHQAELVEAVAAQLETRGYKVHNLAAGLELIDWRFLGRQQAVALALPRHFRRDYLSASAEVAEPLPPRAEVDGEWLRQLQQQKQTAEAKLEDFRAQVDSKRAVSETTGELLESRREQLEQSLPPTCLVPVTRALLGEVWWGEPQDDW